MAEALTEPENIGLNPARNLWHKPNAAMIANTREIDAETEEARLEKLEKERQAAIIPGAKLKHRSTLSGVWARFTRGRKIKTLVNKVTRNFKGHSIHETVLEGMIDKSIGYSEGTKEVVINELLSNGHRVVEKYGCGIYEPTKAARVLNNPNLERGKLSHHVQTHAKKYPEMAKELSSRKTIEPRPKIKINGLADMVYTRVMERSNGQIHAANDSDIRYALKSCGMDYSDRTKRKIISGVRKRGLDVIDGKRLYAKKRVKEKYQVPAECAA